MNFRKVIFENVEKKTFTSQQTYLYIRVTDILKFHEVLFCTYCKGLLCLLKNSHYAYSPPYLHKTLPTLGNEKQQQQIKFQEKSSGELIFSRATKNLKIIYFSRPNGKLLKKQGYTTAMYLIP